MRLNMLFIITPVTQPKIQKQVLSPLLQTIITNPNVLPSRRFFSANLDIGFNERIILRIPTRIHAQFIALFLQNLQPISVELLVKSGKHEQNSGFQFRGCQSVLHLVSKRYQQLSYCSRSVWNEFDWRVRFRVSEF